MKDFERYSRQISIPEIGKEGQQKLRDAKVLIIGAGGLGSPVALYLTAAGVGTIGLTDYDCVSESNLNRQVLYDEKDLGQLKVKAAETKLKGLNSEVCINIYAEKISRNNLAQISNIISCYDIVIDACDNMETRYLASDITERLSIPYIYGAIEGFCGYVSVFNDATCFRRLRDLWPQEEQHTVEAVPAIGTCAGVIGALQANEAIKLICGFGERLSGKLMTVDLCRMEFNVIEL